MEITYLLNDTDALVSLSEHVIREVNILLREKLMSDKNHTSKPIPGGDKQPSNNQGTKPSSKSGTTTGDNTDASQFKKSGNSSAPTKSE